MQTEQTTQTIREQLSITKAGSPLVSLHWRLDPTSGFYQPELARTILTFSGREEYLEWAARWKAEYAALATEIRTLKLQRKQHHMPASESLGSITGKLWRAQTEAISMLTLRRESKLLAQEQYLAARTARQEA